jgi:hypothetical protein
MIVNRDLSGTQLSFLRGHDPADIGPFKPMLLIGGMGIGKSAILNRFIAEQPFVLSAVVRSSIGKIENAAPTNELRDATKAAIDHIGCQFGLPRRSVLGIFICSAIFMVFSHCRFAAQCLKLAFNLFVFLPLPTFVH